MLLAHAISTVPGAKQGLRGYMRLNDFLEQRHPTNVAADPPQCSIDHKNKQPKKKGHDEDYQGNAS